MANEHEKPQASIKISGKLVSRKEAEPKLGGYVYPITFKHFLKFHLLEGSYGYLPVLSPSDYFENKDVVLKGSLRTTLVNSRNGQEKHLYIDSPSFSLNEKPSGHINSIAVAGVLSSRDSRTSCHCGITHFDIDVELSKYDNVTLPCVATGNNSVDIIKTKIGEPVSFNAVCMHPTNLVIDGDGVGKIQLYS